MFTPRLRAANLIVLVCLVAFSDHATAGIGCPCSGDLNGDGKIDSKDISPFIAAYLGVAPNLCADVSPPSGPIPDDADMAQFVSMLLAGADCGLPVGRCCVFGPTGLLGSCSGETQAYCQDNLGGRWTANSSCTSGWCVRNDDCADAILITSGPIYTGSTIYATTDGPSMICEGSCGVQCNTAPDVWYKWVAPLNGQATIQMCDPYHGEACFGCGPDSNNYPATQYIYDSMMVIYDNCPAAGGSIIPGGCNDDGCTSLHASEPSSIIFSSVQAGTTYWIRISGWAGNRGNFTLRTNQP